MTSQTEAAAQPGELVVTFGPETQVLVIGGLRYHVDFLRALGDPGQMHRCLKIVEREPDCITVEFEDHELTEQVLEAASQHRDACVKFVADLFDELRHEHHPVHGYRGTPAMRADLQGRIAELLKVVAPELAPQPLRQDPPKPLGPDVPQMPEAEPAQPLRKDMETPAP